MMYRIFLVVGLFLAVGCSRKKDFEFCFTSIVEGQVFVGTAIVGSAQVPCGVLNAHNAPLSNSEFDFDGFQDLCGKMADGYRMEIPDSAYIGWDNDFEGKTYRKQLALPPFPRLNPGEKYQVGFCIGYQDCVYVRIETVPKY